MGRVARQPRMPARSSGESAVAYIRRLEAAVRGSVYLDWVASDAGQAALDAAARELRIARRGR